MRVGPYAIGSLDVVVDRIRRADVDGFPIVWTHQALGLDPFVAMAVAAREAPRIEIGTALIPAVLRHPQALAAEALTAQAALGGRLTLGVGMSHRTWSKDGWACRTSVPPSSCGSTSRRCCRCSAASRPTCAASG